jgi:hypothetical protein
MKKKKILIELSIQKELILKVVMFLLVFQEEYIKSKEIIKINLFIYKLKKF